MRFLIILTFVICAGCDFDVQQNANESRLEDLVERIWRLDVLFDDEGESVELNDDESYSAYFSSDKKISGEIACNQYLGVYQAEDGGALHIEEKISSTLALCANGAHANLFLESLRSVTRFDIGEDVLALSFGNRGRLIFYEVKNRTTP